MLIWKTDPATGKKYLGLIYPGDMSFTAVKMVNAPTSNSDTGNAGELAFDDDYLYVCVSTDRWKRTPLSNWT